MSIGENIKALREKKGVSQRAVAIELSISPAMLCGIEKGIKQPSLSVAIALATYFDTTVEALTGKEHKTA